MGWILRVAGALVLAAGAHGCTTIAVGRAATVDGSVMATHTDDGSSGSDARLGWLPAADHPPNATRPVYYGALPLPLSISSPVHPISCPWTSNVQHSRAFECV